MLSWPELESFLTDGIAPQGKDIDYYMRQSWNNWMGHYMAIQNSVDYVEWMMENKKIDTETGANLINMLKSTDKDNFNIAILAIEQLKK
jgi:hypothetical protein